MLREIDGVPASTPTGQTLIDKCEVIGFANKAAEQDWAKAENRFGNRELESIIQYVVIKKGEKGHNGMAHCIAIARKKLRENPHKRQTKPETPTGPDMW
jgi:transposase